MQQSVIHFMIRQRWKAVALTAIGVAGRPGVALAATDTALLPRNLSPWNMFANADIVVQVVMVGLALASLATWTIWLAKTVEIRRKTAIARRRLGLLETDTVLSAVEQASRDGGDAVAQIIQSAAREASLSGGHFDDGLKTGSRSASRCGWSGSKPRCRGRSRVVPACWRPSALSRPLSACSERCGAS
jgi:biopolymer transport protein ExbB